MHHSPAFAYRAAWGFVGCMALFGCDEAPKTGQLEIEVPAMAGTTRVHALLQDSSGTPASDVDFALLKGAWNAGVSSLSLSGDYRITVVGTDVSGRETVSNTVDSVKVSEVGATWVHMALQPPRSPDEGESPVVDALLASAQKVEPEQAVEMRVVGHDTKVGGLLSYHWTADCGHLSGNDQAKVTWVAPEEDGDCQLTVGLSNTRGGRAEARMNITVGRARGNVRVVVILNSLPVVARMLAFPTVVEKGVGIDLSTSANDPDGDPLSYQWSSTCPGVFGTLTTANTRFIPNEATESDCGFTVVVSDGHGGKSQGTVVLSGKKPIVNVAPIMGISFQTGQQVAPGSMVLLHMEARDPEGQPLTWTWSASNGTLKNQLDSIGASEATFVAPVEQGVDCSIIVTATDPLGASSSFSFHVRT